MIIFTADDRIRGSNIEMVDVTVELEEEEEEVVVEEVISVVFDGISNVSRIPKSGKGNNVLSRTLDDI